MSLASNRSRSFTSEVADETTRRNSFEDRLLQRKLDDIEKHAAKQKKKLTTEQLEFAVENLSLEDVRKFNNLTRKILRSNYLPPITSNRKNEAVRGDEDVRRNETGSVAERLRGTRMVSGGQSARSTRKLIRSFSLDRSIFPSVDVNSKQENLVLDQTGPSCKVTFSKNLITKRNSASAIEKGSLGHEELRKSIKSPKSNTEKELLFSKLLSESDNETPSLGCKSAKPSDKTLEKSPRNEQKDKLKHECLADAITYKLRMREAARKMMKVEITEPVKDTEDVFLSAYSKKWDSNV